MNPTPTYTELRQAVAEAAPCGTNLEYDPRFLELVRLCEGTREQQYGSTIIAAKPPEWKAIRPLIDELLSETRDLRLGVFMVETAAHFEGFSGCATALEVVRSWVVDLWDDVYPQLDPEDGNDPFIRINALARLCEEHRLPRQLLYMPLADAPPHLRVTLADIELARQPNGKTGSATKLTNAEIDAAFAATELAHLRETYEACQGAYHSVGAIVRQLQQRARDGVPWDAAPLRRRLKECGDVLKTHLRIRMSAADSALAEVSNDNGGRRPQTTEQWPNDFTSESSDHCILEIVSREHAAEIIQAVVEFFESHEPSSPVPLLLRRAKRLINQGFVEILRDVAPDGLTQVQSLAGGLDDS